MLYVLSFGERCSLMSFKCILFGLDMCNSASTEEEAVLYDHRPHQLFEDDYIRVCQIPQRKV